MIELIVDSFAGGGGASTGIEIALGRSPDIAINHDATALAMHEVNHPQTKHLVSDVWEVDPLEVTAGRPVGLAWFSPDCFVPGTLVLTSDGQKPIEQVAVGNMVLTHRGRWRPVTSSLTREAETVEVRGQGHYGLITTPDHLFYSKVITKRWPRGKKWNGKRPAMQRTLVENPYWPTASKMAGKLWATPRAFPDAAIPTCNATLGDDFFYFLGRWIGDGSINKGDVEICCGLKECAEFENWIALHPLRDADGAIIRHRIVDHGSSKLFVWGNASLVRWLEREVRTGSERKRLPLWCLSMQRGWREALLRGYVDADGCVIEQVYQTSSVSKELSISIRLLANGLGYAVSLYRSVGVFGQIEGRSFMGRDSYIVRWRPDNTKETTFSDGLHSFYGVKEVAPAGTRTVVSLQVDEDESFVADGIVVHNCKHFSKAKGGKPVEKKIRGLAWVVVHWANVVAPRVIILENVEEFQTWGPLGADNKPCPIQKGHTFKRWMGELERLGYAVEWRELRACDYGAPTIRKRLFLIARRDGQPIIWPQPSHGDPKSDAVKNGTLKPWRTAAEIIDWSLPCPSIFDSAEEIMAKYGLRAVRPLQPATMARIAKGVKRYVLDAAKPFIVRTDMASGSPRNGVHSTDEPVRTMTSAQSFAVVTPFVTGVGGRMAQTEPRAADQPAQTLTAKADSVLVAPYLARTAHGEADKNGKKRGQGTHSLQDPHGTVLASPDHALIMPFISAAQQGGSVRSPIYPLHTVTASAKDQNQVIAPFVTKFNRGATGHAADDPLHTVTACHSDTHPGGASTFGVVAASLIKNNFGDKPHCAVDEPLRTITTGGHHALVAAFMAQHNYLEPGHDAREPVSTIVGKGSTQAVVSAGLTVLKGSDRRDSEIDAPAPTATAQGGHLAETRAFLTKYYGVDQDPRLEDPLHTATAKDRFGLVTVDIEGETYVITDIGMRMLTPRELFRAQGFLDSYIIDRKPDGTPISKTEQVSKCGNSVCPPLAAALVKANYSPREVEPAPQFMEAAE